MFNVLLQVSTETEALTFLYQWMEPGPALVPVCRVLCEYLFSKSDIINGDKYDDLLSALVKAEHDEQALSLAADILQYILDRPAESREQYKKSLALNPSMIGTTVRFFDLLIDRLDDHDAVRAYIHQPHDFSTRLLDPIIFQIWSDTLVLRLHSLEDAQAFHLENVRSSGGRASHAAPAAMFLLQHCQDIAGARALFQKALAISEHPEASIQDKMTLTPLIYFGTMLAFDLNDSSGACRMFHKAHIELFNQGGYNTPIMNIIMEIVAFASNGAIDHELEAALENMPISNSNRALIEFITNRLSARDQPRVALKAE